MLPRVLWEFWRIPSAHQLDFEAEPRYQLGSDWDQASSKSVSVAST